MSMASELNPATAPITVVLDTNIVLDLFLFQDARIEALRGQLRGQHIRWIATPHMRSELERVLTYTHIAAKLTFYQKNAQEILAAFDRSVQCVEAPGAKAPYTCTDPDDQVFIDLACYAASIEPLRQVQLISKDKAVLSMRKRLERLSVVVKQHC